MRPGVLSLTIGALIGVVLSITCYVAVLAPLRTAPEQLFAPGPPSLWTQALLAAVVPGLCVAAAIGDSGGAIPYALGLTVNALVYGLLARTVFSVVRAFGKRTMLREAPPN